MAELSARRVVAIAAVAGALVGGAVGAVAAAWSTSGDNNGTASGATGDTGSLTTAEVVRTTLTNTVQVGGSISYGGSYTVALPSGASAQQVTGAELAVTEDKQTLSADEEAVSNGSSAGNQSTQDARTNLATAHSTLGSDESQKANDCAGKGASTPACSHDARKLSQDQIQLTQAEQQLAMAEVRASGQDDQSAAKVQADETRLQGDEATVASLQAIELNPGTTFTWLPQVGATIKQDQPVYSLSTEPVPLLYGSVPAYRAFYAGMSAGADVGELTRDIIALGYGAGLTQSNDYSSATASAVERWQTALGLPASGEIMLGAVVFEVGPIRVTSVTPSVGASLGSGGGNGAGGSVLSATSTTPIVSVDLDVSDEYLVKPGNAVSVVLPDGTSTIGGHIETVGNVATCAGGGSIGVGGSAGESSTSPCSSIGSGTSSTPTVTVTIALDETLAGASLDQAPVNVNLTTQAAAHVLATPVNALLALAGGGFGVDVVTGSVTHLVGVTPGLYSNTLVQITGPGIRAGTVVEVPSS